MVKNLAIAGILLLTAACTPEGNEVMLEVSVQPKWNGQDLTYQNLGLVHPQTGDTFRFDRSDMLLSEIALIKEDGSLLPLVTQDGEPLFAFFTKGKPWTIDAPDNIPKGHYRGISFKVGLDSAINFGDPSVWKVGHPLNPTVNSLHWGWQGGYVFMALEGFYKELGESKPFLYHIATLENRMPVVIEGDLHLTGSRKLILNWNADRLFYGAHGIRPEEDGSFSHSTFDGGLANRISQNASLSFEWVALENKK